MYFLVDPAILGRCGLRKAMKQGRGGGDVLARPSEVRKGFTIGDDPSVHVTGHGACVPTISVAFDLLIDFHVLPYKLLPDFIYFLLLGSQLLHPYMMWGRCPPFGCATEVACRGSLLHGDAFRRVPRRFPQ